LALAPPNQDNAAAVLFEDDSLKYRNAGGETSVKIVKTIKYLRACLFLHPTCAFDPQLVNAFREQRARGQRDRPSDDGTSSSTRRYAEAVNGARSALQTYARDPPVCGVLASIDG